MDTVHTVDGLQGSARAASVFSLGLGPFHAGRLGVSRSSRVQKNEDKPLYEYITKKVTWKK